MKYLRFNVEFIKYLRCKCGGYCFEDSRLGICCYRCLHLIDDYGGLYYESLKLYRICG
jgi:hypothetical protein